MVLKDNALFLDSPHWPRAGTFAISQTRFVLAGASVDISFERDDQDRVTMMKIRVSGGGLLKYTRND